MLGSLRGLVERLEGDRRWRVLELLARGPMSEAELGRHFRLPLTLGWHLRELHSQGLVAYSRRGNRYHLVWPALEALVGSTSELADQAALTAPAASGLKTASRA